MNTGPLLTNKGLDIPAGVPTRTVKPPLSSAGSFPLVLNELNQKGQLHRGDRILLSGFGAGLAWGTGVYGW